jgi:hypothetical protein
MQALKNRYALFSDTGASSFGCILNSPLGIGLQ